MLTLNPEINFVSETETEKMTNTNNLLKFRSVLLIDDNEIDNFVNKRLVQKCLGSKVVHTFTHAKDALEHLTKTKDFPNLIILDIMMPEMDGFEFLDKFVLFDFEKRLNTKIIMLSSTESFRDLNKANSNKLVYKFLSKPLTHAMLNAIL